MPLSPMERHTLLINGAAPCVIYVLKFVLLIVLKQLLKKLRLFLEQYPDKLKPAYHF